MSTAPLHTPALAPGRMLAHFEIKELLGRGGMGAVYKAHDQQLGRTVALKTLSPELLKSEAALARFRQEAQSASLVGHANVVQIFSFGVEQDIPYIAMEYLKGESLAARIARGPLSVNEAVDVILPVCSGVFAANHRGILHRDIKPANIFLSRQFTGLVPKVLDFGVAKLSSAKAVNGRLTATGTIMGTLLYLAPEQAMDADVDARADQYALAVVLYECLTQRTPHEGKTGYRLFQDLATGTFPRPSELVQGLPKDFEKVILAAMSVERDHRYMDLRAFGRALLRFASPTAQSRWTEHYEAPLSSFDELEQSMLGPSASAQVPERVMPATEVLPNTPRAPVAPLAATRLLPQPTRVLAEPLPPKVEVAAPAPRRPGLPRLWVALGLGAAFVMVAVLAAAAAVAYMRLSEGGRAPAPGPRVMLPDPPAQVAPIVAPQVAPAPVAVPEPVEPPAQVKAETPSKPKRRASSRKPKSPAEKPLKPVDPNDVYYTPDGVPVF